MAFYTVHEPPGAPVAPWDRMVFIRDGFSLFAAVAAPVWMLCHRLWLVLVLYLALMSALVWGLAALGASRGVMLGVLALIALLLGLEASTLRRWTLARRGWREAGVVSGETRELAEFRFFQGIDVPSPAAPAAEPGFLGGRLRRADTEGVIGLFPEARP